MKIKGQSLAILMLLPSCLCSSVDISQRYLNSDFHQKVLHTFYEDNILQNINIINIIIVIANAFHVEIWATLLE